ncbi:hypothetical protein BD560DRAFT_382386 [Blakeslea trispora]|nr:hypothetical protein BD560DRAFT_382386 [Blakeslea trispora]
MQLCFLLLLLVSLLVYQVTALPTPKQDKPLCLARMIARKRGLPEENNAKQTQEAKQTTPASDINTASVETGTASIIPGWNPGQDNQLSIGPIYPDSLVSCDQDVEDEEMYDKEQDCDDNELPCPKKAAESED